MPTVARRPDASDWQRFGPLLLAAVVAIETGCATLPPAETGHQTNLGRIAIVAAPERPAFRFEGFVRSKGEGALTSAGATFGACVNEIAIGNCTGSMCGAALILWLGICGVAGIVGGVAGAIAAPSAAAMRATEGSMAASLDAAAIQDSLRGQLEAAALADGALLAAVPADAGSAAARARDYRPLAAAGADTVAEVALTEVGISGRGIDSPGVLAMKARVRLVRTADNAELVAGDLAYLGPRLRLSEWSAMDGHRLMRALQTGIDTLGAQLGDNLFLLYPFPDRAMHGAGWLSSAFGLAPVEPETRGQLTGDRLIGDRFEWVTADSLSPTFRWQSFPRPGDVAAAPDDMARVRNVRYDLVVAREKNLAPEAIVYRQEGLVRSTHTVTAPLAPATRYFWTVRARFELDGRERVTEWGATRANGAPPVAAPSSWSYRFRTD